MKNEITDEESLDTVKQALEAYVGKFGFKEDAAKSLGVSRVFLWRMLSGERPISESVLNKLGYEKNVEVYVTYNKKEHDDA